MKCFSVWLLWDCCACFWKTSSAVLETNWIISPHWQRPSLAFISIKFWYRIWDSITYFNYLTCCFFSESDTICKSHNLALFGLFHSHPCAHLQVFFIHMSCPGFTQFYLSLQVSICISITSERQGRWVQIWWHTLKSIGISAPSVFPSHTSAGERGCLTVAERAFSLQPCIWHLTVAVSASTLPSCIMSRLAFFKPQSPAYLVTHIISC